MTEETRTPAYCPECGTYQPHKPRVEMQRRPDLRGWEVFVYVDYGNGVTKGLPVVIPDNPEVQWRIGAPQNLTDGVGMYL